VSFAIRPSTPAFSPAIRLPERSDFEEQGDAVSSQQADGLGDTGRVGGGQDDRPHLGGQLAREARREVGGARVQLDAEIAAAVPFETLQGRGRGAVVVRERQIEQAESACASGGDRDRWVRLSRRCRADDLNGLLIKTLPLASTKRPPRQLERPTFMDQ